MTAFWNPAVLSLFRIHGNSGSDERRGSRSGVPSQPRWIRETIGTLVSQYKVTMMLATADVSCKLTHGEIAPEDFGSLRFVMAGAEKLPARVSEAFEDHFGIRPLEGYGPARSVRPFVSVNTADFRAASFRQVGAKRGSIGHPFAGNCFAHRRSRDGSRTSRSISQDCCLVRGAKRDARLFGPAQRKTAEVLRDGWYNTGDNSNDRRRWLCPHHGSLEAASAKIGGEMGASHKKSKTSCRKSPRQRNKYLW